MSREARKQLADLRAMEEQYERQTMRGSGKHFTGAGATPSMGLSQFRGGMTIRAPTIEKKSETLVESLMKALEKGGKLTKKHKELLMSLVGTRRAGPPILTHTTALLPLGVRGRGKLEITHHDEESEEEESEEEMEGGAISTAALGALRTGLATGVGRAVRSGVGAIGRTRPSVLQSAVRFGERMPLLTARPPPLVRPTTIRAPRVPFGSVPRATIGTRLGTAAALGANVTKYGLTRILRPSVISKLAAIGIPIGILADYLSDKSQASGDAGFYDEYAGGIPAGGEGTGTGGTGTGGTGTGGTGTGMEGATDEEIIADIVNAINRGEVPDFIRTGIYELGFSKPISRGSGKKVKKAKSKATGKRAERAAIVKQVMKERGVSLAQASKIVKEEGLY